MSKAGKKKTRNIIGPTIRRIRLSQSIPVTQEDLAGRLAARGITIDRSAIARIEKGERNVTDSEAMAIARAFKVPIERLFESCQITR